MTQWLKNPPVMQKTQETWIQFLSWEDALEEEMATHSSILAWRIPWTGVPGMLVHGVIKSQTQLSTWHIVCNSFSYNSAKLETTDMSINRWKDRQLVMQWCLFNNKKKWTCATTWMKLKITFLSERNQTKSNISCMIPFIKKFRLSKLIYHAGSIHTDTWGW